MTTISPLTNSNEKSPAFSSSDTTSDNRKIIVTTEKGVAVQQPLLADDSHSTMECPISREHATFWQNNGYLLMDNIFNEQLITLIRDATIPMIDNDRARSRLWHEGHVQFPFPFADEETLILNKIPLHSRLNQAVMALMNTDHYEILLSRADVSVQMLSPDQPLHLDLVNQHSLMLPDIATDCSGVKIPDVLTAIVYLEEGDICAGKNRIE